MQLVIPDLTRNPGFFWIPAFAGTTGFVVINDVMYIIMEPFFVWLWDKHYLSKVFLPFHDPMRFGRFAQGQNTIDDRVNPSPAGKI